VISCASGGDRSAAGIRRILLMDAAARCLLVQFALGATLLCSHHPAAQAQAIIKCMIDGRLVYQSTPCALEPRPGVASAPVALAAVNPAAPKKKTLADVLRERDGGDQVRPASREPQGDGANVLRARMGAF
jgi:hypothetical protein